MAAPLTFPFASSSSELEAVEPGGVVDVADVEDAGELVLVSEGEGSAGKHSFVEEAVASMVALVVQLPPFRGLAWDQSSPSLRQ